MNLHLVSQWSITRKHSVRQFKFLSCKGLTPPTLPPSLPYYISSDSLNFLKLPSDLRHHRPITRKQFTIRQFKFFRVANGLTSPSSSYYKETLFYQTVRQFKFLNAAKELTLSSGSDSLNRELRRVFSYYKGNILSNRFFLEFKLPMGLHESVYYYNVHHLKLKSLGRRVPCHRYQFYEHWGRRTHRYEPSRLKTLQEQQ
jgi:hypothetical protein